MVWHGADSRNCSWSSNVVRANTVTVSVGTQFKWASRLQARRSNNSSTECLSRSTEYSAKNYFYGIASWRRCQGLSNICVSEHTMVKSSNDHFKSSPKRFRRAPAKDDLQYICQRARARSPQQISMQNLYHRWPGKISVPGLCKFPLWRSL